MLAAHAARRQSVSHSRGPTHVRRRACGVGRKACGESAACARERAVVALPRQAPGLRVAGLGRGGTRAPGPPLSHDAAWRGTVPLLGLYSPSTGVVTGSSQKGVLSARCGD
ncbi:hypothetical protein TRVL_05372 [Trypanosoma vivax]|nr:hypothetical protein TRVL_05372 [Trypanosoma vivax]